MQCRLDRSLGAVQARRGFRCCQADKQSQANNFPLAFGQLTNESVGIERQLFGSTRMLWGCGFQVSNFVDCYKTYAGAVR